MYRKQVSYIIVICLMWMCFFPVTATAARTDEFEMYNVEFQALTPDDMAEAVEVVLTHKTESYELKYSLHKKNDYFSNELVPPGEYDVIVRVETDDPIAYGLIYDKTLLIQPSNLAVSFTIIIDRLTLQGDASTSTQLPDSDQITQPPASLPNTEKAPIKENNNSSNVPFSSANQKDSLKSIIISFVFSMTLIAIAFSFLYFWKKRR